MVSRPPAFGELGHQEQAPAAFVEDPGAAQMQGGAAVVGETSQVRVDWKISRSSTGLLP